MNMIFIEFVIRLLFTIFYGYLTRRVDEKPDAWIKDSGFLGLNKRLTNTPDSLYIHLHHA